MPVGDVPALPPPHSRSCVAYVLPLSGGEGGKFHLCVSSTYCHGPRAWPNLPTACTTEAAAASSWGWRDGATV